MLSPAVPCAALVRRRVFRNMIYLHMNQISGGLQTCCITPPPSRRRYKIIRPYSCISSASFIKGPLSGPSSRYSVSCRVHCSSSLPSTLLFTPEYVSHLIYGIVEFRLLPYGDRLPTGTGSVVFRPINVRRGRFLMLLLRISYI